MSIPGLGTVVSIVTFPGIAARTLARQILCRLLHIPVLKVVYFRAGAPCGYVDHESCEDARKVFLICSGPFLINTLLGILLMAPAAMPILKFREYTNPLYLLSAWLGFSLLVHAFPRVSDAIDMAVRILGNKNVGLLPKLLSAPVIALLCAGAFSSLFWLNLIYAAAAAMLLSEFLTIL